jgi:RNA polymerase sigma-70 factor (ECF subfamily)
MRDETELIRAAAAGDREAFDELVRAKRERVVRTAYQVTGNLEDALDVAQAVFVKVWRGIDRFDTRRRFDTWLYRVTSNAAIDLLRSRGPRGTLQPLPEDPSEFEAASERPGAEAALDLSRLQEVFSRLAGRLAPKQRLAFVLREIEGNDTAEVARIMNVTESTVRNHLLQARRILREAILREHPELVPHGARESEDVR